MVLYRCSRRRFGTSVAGVAALMTLGAPAAASRPVRDGDPLADFVRRTWPEGRPRSPG